MRRQQKIYDAGGERIVSQELTRSYGDANVDRGDYADAPHMDYAALRTSMEHAVKKAYEQLGVHYEGSDTVAAMTKPRKAGDLPGDSAVGEETRRFFYHKDHLGGTSIVTDKDGNAVQRLTYLPYGEVFTDALVDSSFVSPYKFTGKELDEETGLYYFGARYYNPRYSLWYGTDPLQEKYPWVSSYCYTIGNPVIYYDEDGRIPFTSSVKYTRISSRFGRRFHPIQKRWKVHGGIDLAAPKGSEVHSLADGKVKKIGWDPKGYGRYVIIQHDEGYESLYAHLEKDGVLLKQNDVVKENDIIAYSGNTGGSTAPHLHIEIGKGDILQNKNKINPESIEDLQQYL